MNAEGKATEPVEVDRDEKAEIDRLAELANIGAGRAADAFAQLVRRTIWIDVPVVVEGAESRGGADDAATGVFFQLEGCLDAMIGILFPAAASDSLVRRIVGIEQGELEPTVIESALMEVGNILASHVASAIADTLGARLLPSIPTLAMEDAELAFRSFIEEAVGPDALRIESALHDREQELRGRLVLVPVGRSKRASNPVGSEIDDV